MLSVRSRRLLSGGLPGSEAAQYCSISRWFGKLGDKLESVVADDLWPLPTYREMLFIK